MAFCNKCGAPITPGTRFCNKCGAPILASGFPSSAPNAVPSAPAQPSTQSPMQPAPQGSGNALKVVLIVIGAIILIGAVSIAALTFVGLRIARRTHVNQQGDRVKVETPFGTVESTKDPEEAAKNLGVEIYPGAEPQKDGSASASFGSLHTVNVSFQSSDSVQKVCNFYRSKFPNATVSTSDENHCTIVSNAPPNVITINVDPSGDGAKFQISSVNKK